MFTESRNAGRAVLSLGLALALALAGCAGTPKGMLSPVQTAGDGTSKVDLLVATTRAPTSAPGMLFSGERGPDVSLDRIVVSIPPESARKVGEVQWPKKVPGNPRTDFVTSDVERLDSTAARGWFRKTAGRKRQLLLFVHGFNNRYEESVFRFAQIVHDSGTDFAPLLFTWPSRGSVFAYGYDRESTNFSRDGLEKVLQEAVASPDVGSITVLAHSMGSWLAVESLRQLAIRQGKIPPKIDNVILASPDIDVDVFRKQMQDMGPDRPHFTIFVSRDDQALRLSRAISGGVDRLGSLDPTQEPYRSVFEKDDITVLDLTALRTGDSLNHSKFAESPEVVRLLGQRLIDGQTVTDSDTGLGQRLGSVLAGAAQSAGSAASVAVSLPISVFDPRTRENLGEQMGAVRQSVGNTFYSAAGH
ncbi:Esterase/lipase superfamily enzyme [Faunimonas pinastri]|uniref:Esterase/lipase superfamily enzyme n=1 Tax=Faunimonas pinastri TaxID=1855383 RepID=A0A1H9K7R8_9HYPH|nr:alpha/beta hydrolase [Faunimonas pinastri]SEQ95266.1 Esterase/lipase superfamily enzyme [Faunimonas pinastri]